MQQHIPKDVVGTHLGFPPHQGVEEFPDREPSELECEYPDHHQGKCRRKCREECRARNGRGVLKEPSAAPGDGLAQEETQVERYSRGSEKQHQCAGQPLPQYIQNGTGKVSERNAEIPSEGILEVNQVLLPQRLVQTECLTYFVLDVRRQVWVQYVEGSVVAGLRLNE